MERLSANRIKGVWAGVPMSWHSDNRFDEQNYSGNIERICRARVHGVYTTGSTGEFYALDFEEFKQMVDIQAEVCGKNEMPLQIGCCADNTREVIRLVEYAATKKEVGAVQIVIPYWMELSDRELLQFFKDVYVSCSEMPLVHYNIPRAKRFLGSADYLRILEVAPSLVGVKFTFAGAHFGALQQALLDASQLSYFVAENLLVSAMMLGVSGTYSSLVLTNPDFMLTMYEHAEKEEWRVALEMQKTAVKFFADSEKFAEDRGEGTIDPVFDKGLGVATGCLLGSARTRAPYIGWSDEMVVAAREWVGQNYPQFIYPENLS